jgi:hypothetical protein
VKRTIRKNANRGGSGINQINVPVVIKPPKTRVWNFEKDL